MKFDPEQLAEDYANMMEKYDALKVYIKQYDKYLYERWKAGGFLIDEDILSMYPTLGQVIAQLTIGDEDEYN